MNGSSSKAANDASLSVTQLLRRMKNLLEIQVGEVWVVGEVSNLRKQASGHWYFSLKDEGAQISCAIFGARKREGADALQDGAKVRVFAEASVYEARGQLQIIVQKVERAGAGDLQARFEALKHKLHAEGLFDASRKMPLPKHPKAIGLITSGTGAALQDMLNVLKRRAPWVQPVLMPVRVQGKGAELEIASAIEQMGNPARHGLPVCDVLIVGRGGGSIEDLWNFNEEVVARAIAACPIPIISAVGHEIDFTIADFVADLRAPTPSAAAEMAVADGAELSQHVGQLARRMSRAIQQRMLQAQASVDSLRRGVLQRDALRLLRQPMMQVDTARHRLEQSIASRIDDLTSRLHLMRIAHQSQHPSKVLERRIDALVNLRRRLERATRETVDGQVRKLDRLQGLLRALGPQSAFQRGFSITMKADGSIVRSAAQLSEGELLSTHLADGVAVSRVVTPDA